jgi:chondroitin AC lyase
VIGVPQAIGDITILMAEELTPEEREIMVNRILPRGKIGMTGQNRVWVASITLVRGLVVKDRALVEAAARVIGEEIRLTTNEGVQPDYSFHQHGPQQQFGNYGLAFAGSAASWMLAFKGTPFELPRAKTDIIHDYLILGENWVVWRGLMDLSSCNRQLGSGSQQSKGRGVARTMEIMSQVDPARATDYQAHLKRNAAGGVNELLGNKYFWRSDYMIQRGTDYYASVKMSSKRVIGAELVNSENVSGLHLGDGALYIYRSGQEYEDIQPVWDWQKIPGTTCAQLAKFPVKYGHSQVQSDFVGGVSDGWMGCAALDYTRAGVTARKAWFFLNGAIACLGSGITGTGAEPVVTAINQCWLKGDVTVGAASGSQKLPRGEHDVKNLNWTWHDGIGYVFPKGADVRLRLGEQRGSWRKVEDKEIVAEREERGDVLLVTYEHGVQPRGQAYAYLMFPGAKADAMSAKSQSPAVEVLSNSPALQAVRSADRTRIQAVFFESGKLEYAPGRTVAVDQPCLVLVDATGGPGRVTVAEPTQKLEAVNVTVDGLTHVVELPRGGQAGKSVTVE